ncbi:MAG TPA: hypothetical protein ENI08_02450 [Candidatus Dependentiae bacterium]|nr:hypothetical protein [Candidatus Dependentiae bacterium]
MSRKKIQSTIIYIIIGIGSLFLIGHRFFPLFPRMMAQASSCIAYPALVVHCHVIDPIKVWFYQRKTMQKLRQKLEKIYKERDTLLAENIALRAAAAIIGSVGSYFSSLQLKKFLKNHKIDYTNKTKTDHTAPDPFADLTEK